MVTSIGGLYEVFAVLAFVGLEFPGHWVAGRPWFVRGGAVGAA